MLFHPYAEIFPMMQRDEFDRLVADIKDNGLIEDIVTHDNKILDGRNRYRACIEAGIAPRFRDFGGPGSPLSFVMSVNLNRRHMNTSQRALAAAKAKPLFEEEARARQGHGRTAPGKPLSADLREALGTGKSSERAAELFNVSPRLVEAATTVASKGVDELVNMVRDGDIRVSAAAPVANLPESEQRRLIAQGTKYIRELGNDVPEKSADNSIAQIHKSIRRFCKHYPEEIPLLVQLTYTFLDDLTREAA